MREQPVGDFCVVEAVRCRGEDRGYLLIAAYLVSGGVLVLEELDSAIACRASSDEGKSVGFGVLAASSLGDVQPSESVVTFGPTRSCRRPFERCESAVLIVLVLLGDTARWSRLFPQVLRLLGTNRLWLGFETAWTRVQSQRLLPESEPTWFNFGTTYWRGRR